MQAPCRPPTIRNTRDLTAMTGHIRLATAADAAAIAEIYQPVVVSSTISFEIDPPDGREMQRRIEETLPGYPWLVCEHRDRVIGYAYASRHAVRAAYQWSINASVYVHGEFRRYGVATGLYVSLFAIAAAQGYVNAYAGITLPNAASVALHESVGFEPLGVYRRVGYKLGAWHDVGWWQRAIGEHSDTPKTPRSLADLEHDRSWATLTGAGLSSIRGLERR